MRGNIFQKVSYAGLVGLEFSLGEKDKNIFEQQVFGVVTTCCRMAYEQHLSKSIIQTHKALSTLSNREVRVAQ